MLNQFYPNLIRLQASLRRLEVFIKKSNLSNTCCLQAIFPRPKIVPGCSRVLPLGLMIKLLSMWTPKFILLRISPEGIYTGKKNLIVNVTMHGGIA